jgi:hypothetical protein
MRKIQLSNTVSKRGKTELNLKLGQRIQKRAKDKAIIGRKWIIVLVRTECRYFYILNYIVV